MTFREWRERVAAIKCEMQSARERLSHALQAMDYAVALASQMELDHLQREAQQLRRRKDYMKIS